MNRTQNKSAGKGALLRSILRFVYIAVFVLFVLKLMSWSMLKLDTNPNLMLGLTVLLLLCYVVLISIPFVPGIEIALSIMLIKGPEVAIWVYLATVFGLFLSFLAGQFIRYPYLHRVFHDLRLKRACNLLETLQPLTGAERLSLIRDKAPLILRPFVIEGRYVVIAAALNIPGNALIGGGGGILMVAGLTRVFSSFWILITLLIAVSPVPIAILVFDIDPMAFMRKTQ